jgi:dUTPase
MKNRLYYNGDRIAQIIVQRITHVEWETVIEINETTEERVVLVILVNHKRAE